jgi:hypothetical protein
MLRLKRAGDVRWTRPSGPSSQRTPSSGTPSSWVAVFESIITMCTSAISTDIVPYKGEFKLRAKTIS